MGLFLFGTVMCISYVSFFPEEWSRHFFEVLKKRPTLCVAFDQNCSPCMSFARVIRMLDFFGKILQDDASNPEFQFLSDAPLNARITSIHSWNFRAQTLSNGFNTIIEISEQIILLWPFVPVLKAMRFFGIGEPFYRMFSQSDWRTQCKAGTCRLPPTSPSSKVGK